MRKTRDNRIFSRGIEELTLPSNPRWSTHTRVLLPCFTKEQVIIKTAPSPSPERRASHRVQSSCLGLPQTPRAHQEPPDHQDYLGVVKHQE